LTEDDEVVAAAKRGDPEAWRKLYRAHAGRLLVWLETRSGPDTAVSAEDLLAETWLIAARRVHEFSGDSDSFAGWLFGIGRRLAANNRRRFGRRRTEPAGLQLVETSVDGHEHAVTDLDWVRATLATLSPRERDVLTCLDVVGLSIADTAVALRISESAVRVARHRGLTRLRVQADETREAAT
jgi:RNA polymerase sigma-70 factor (ECF subfamily)